MVMVVVVIMVCFIVMMIIIIITIVVIIIDGLAEIAESGIGGVGFRTVAKPSRRHLW